MQNVREDCARAHANNEMLREFLKRFLKLTKFRKRLTQQVIANAEAQVATFNKAAFATVEQDVSHFSSISDSTRRDLKGAKIHAAVAS